MTVPEGRLFLLGDHRANANDSRYFLGEQSGSVAASDYAAGSKTSRPRHCGRWPREPSEPCIGGHLAGRRPRTADAVTTGAYRMHAGRPGVEPLGQGPELLRGGELPGIAPDVLSDPARQGSAASGLTSTGGPTPRLGSAWLVRESTRGARSAWSRRSIRTPRLARLGGTGTPASKATPQGDSAVSPGEAAASAG
ncbi:S26 family signal peptidase [Streptomyces tendae]|uniref:S26 family signal peptidase n=1 Tax=Streptomyces tendae TaxID=1932 RepID=UPI003570D600